MKSVVLAGLLFCALAAAAFSLFGDGSYGRMQGLERSLVAQQEKNVELKTQVLELRREVHGLQHDPRVLEKAARNELGLARPDEMVIVFDRDSGHDR